MKKNKKMLVATIEDCDFGDVNVYYFPDENAIVADGLTILDMPKEGDWMANNVPDMLDYAWGVYKYHYCTYGAMCVSFPDIPILNELIDDMIN